MTVAGDAATVVGLAAFAATGLLGRRGWGGDGPAPRGRDPDRHRRSSGLDPGTRRTAPSHRPVVAHPAGRRVVFAAPVASARWARGRDLATLTVATRRRDRRSAPPARLVIGRSGRRTLAAEPGQSVIVFGPTQSRKTTGFAIPALVDWPGPVVATSVKGDLFSSTSEERRRRGAVVCFDPSGTIGAPTVGWSPLHRARTWPAARRMASALTDTAKGEHGGMADGDFWYATAAKLLAPLLFAAAATQGSMADVVRWVDTQEEVEVLDLLYGVGVPEAVDAARACFAKEDRQRGSIYTTAETVMAPFADQAHVEMTGEVDPPTLISGANTLYLCAPSHEQQRLRPLFVGVVRDILAEVYERVTRSGRPLHPPLLLLLDEAANIAPLPELDAVASTAAGQGIQLVTIWQDIAQITARYGARGATVVNNHRAKVFLSGISDPGTLDQASHLIGEAERPIRTRTSGAAGGATTSDTPGYRRLVPPDALRRIPPGHGVLVYGSLPPARITLRAEPIGTDRGSVPRRSRWAMMGADGR